MQPLQLSGNEPLLRRFWKPGVVDSEITSQLLFCRAASRAVARRLTASSAHASSGWSNWRREGVAKNRARLPSDNGDYRSEWRGRTVLRVSPHLAPLIPTG